MIDYIQLVMTWVFAPISGIVLFLLGKQQDHQTRIAVIEKIVDSNRSNHEREISEMRATVRAIFAKLDSIENALRK